MYMYLKSINVVVVFLQPIFTDTNLTKAKIRKVRNYIECCFSGLKCLLSTLTYNSSHLFLDENMICQ